MMLKWLVLLICLSLTACENPKPKIENIPLQNQEVKFKTYTSIGGRKYKDFDLFNLKGIDEVGEKNTLLKFVELKEENGNINILTSIGKHVINDLQIIKKLKEDCSYTTDSLIEPEVQTTTIDEKYLSKSRVLVFTSQIDHKKSNHKSLYQVTELKPKVINQYSIDSGYLIEPSCNFKFSSIPKGKVRTITTWTIRNERDKVIISKKFKDLEGITEIEDKITSFEADEFSYYWDVYINELNLL